jgi:hypothetical protein
MRLSNSLLDFGRPSTSSGKAESPGHGHVIDLPVASGFCQYLLRIATFITPLAAMIHTLRNRSVKPGYFKISSSTPSIFGTILARSIASTPARLGPWLLPLTTLLPQHLQPSDFRSLSGKGIVYANTLACLSRSQLRFSQQNNKATPFPEDAKGFWYLHPGPSHAPIAGELRFRIVESGNPEDFISGHDLVDVYGSLPWSIPLPSLLRHKVYAALASLLLLSGPNAHYSSIVRQINNNKMPIINTDATIIHSLGQPLYLDLSKTAAGYRIASGNKLNPSPSHFGLFTDWRKKTRGFTPYTGMFR